MTRVNAKDIDFNNLGFDYMDLPYRYVARYRNGQWEKGELSDDSDLHVSEGSTALHYGQSAFEGLKAYRTPEGKAQLFRPDQNAKRLIASCNRLLMPEFPEEDFIEAAKEVVKANLDFVPPHESGGTLYLRPIMMGVGGQLGVHPAKEYIFTIFASPVGDYFKGGMTPTSFVTSDYDRAAHQGTGKSKVGGNYAASLLPGEQAKKDGYSDVVYLDPLTHKNIEEVGAANFFGITKDNEFKTPLSPSILPSITKYSLLWLAEHRLGLKVSECDIPVDELDQFKEAGACGTAAVISPIGSLTHHGNKHVFYSETEVGPLTTELFDTLKGIQFGTVAAPEGWIVTVN